jgi:dTDP-4-amino-4,6-dideoxygalactose transaminase
MGYDFDIDFENIGIKKNNIFDYMADYNCIYTDSGRTCIKLVSQLFAGKEILVPAFSCFSVIYGFAYRVKPVFYAVNMDFTLNLDDIEKKITNQTAGIYITNYFGHRINENDSKKIMELKRKYNLLIVEDNTQSLFSGKPTVGDYSISSIRKWFPVPDGGVLYSKNDLSCINTNGIKRNSKQNKKLYPQVVKHLFLKEKLDIQPKYFVDMFADVEKELDCYSDNNEKYLMSDFTEFMFKCNDVYSMIEKRKENEKILRSAINSPYLVHAIEKRNENEVPFNLPMYCTVREKMWNYLVDEFLIYPSVLWRTYLYDEVNNIGDTKKMGEQIISFPVDQRYCKEDMLFLADAINSFKI